MTSDTTPMRFGVRPEYNETTGKPVTRFGRELLTIWSGAFMAGYCGEAVQLPKGDGYMVTLASLGNIRRVRVECESPRTNENWTRVDDAINAAINKDLFGTEPGATVESEATS